MKSRCNKGKSCGATCIERSKWCELELGPRISKSLKQAQKRIGVLGLFSQVRKQGIKGYKAKFDAIRKELKGELGRQIRKTDDVQELKKRLQAKGLLPKTESSAEKKPWEVGDLFKKKEPEKGQSVPKDLRNLIKGLPNNNPSTPSERYRRRVAEAEDAARRGEKPPAVEGRNLDRSPGAKTKTPPILNKKNTELLFDDISRMMRGESPLHIEIASAPGYEGFKARFLPTKTAPGSATGNTKWARQDAEDYDGALVQGSLRREGSKSFNKWDGSYGSGATKIGEGSYGTVMRNPDGTFIKRGAVSETEAALIRRLGEKDLGPRLIAADINGKHPYQQERFVDIRDGRIAMSQVSGSPMGASTSASKQFGGKNAADVYWKALADLHRLGIAHNDAHIDNILVDSKGKGRWVDLGLAQASPKAALAEAMGIFETLKGAPATRVEGAAGQGNWQTRRWDGTGFRQAESARRSGAQNWEEFQKRFPVAAQVWENRPAAQYQLLKMGLTREDVSTIIDHGIRSTPESYNRGPWAKLTDQQALQVLNTLYDGI